MASLGDEEDPEPAASKHQAKKTKIKQLLQNKTKEICQGLISRKKQQLWPMIEFLLFLNMASAGLRLIVPALQHENQYCALVNKFAGMWEWAVAIEEAGS